MTKEKYISLKEAASLSGYTSDYIGQLIRGGKLQGKQVFSNVSWVTTEEALTEYIEKNNKNFSDIRSLGWKQTLVEYVDFPLVYKVVLGMTISLLISFILFLIYIVSVSIDRKIDDSYQHKIEQL